MIGYLKGEVISSDQRLVVLCGGVGYEVFVPSSLLDIALGKGIELYVYHHVREEEQKLFGFDSQNALELFKLLIKVNGVGPRVALGIFSTYSVDRIIEALRRSDERLFASVSGIGKKVASKIILELSGKVGGLEVGTVQSGESGQTGANRGEVIDALVALGYAEREVYLHLDGVDEDLSVEEKIKVVLKKIGSGK
jgi:Holliday junction DNA helicase RuvA